MLPTITHYLTPKQGHSDGRFGRDIKRSNKVTGASDQSPCPPLSGNKGGPCHNHRSICGHIRICTVGNIARTGSYAPKRIGGRTHSVRSFGVADDTSTLEAQLSNVDETPRHEHRPAPSVMVSALADPSS